MKSIVRLIAMATGIAVSASAANAEIVVGLNLSLSGPAAGLGLPVQKTLEFFPKQIGGETVRYIVLDDNTDPSAAVRNVRKLASESNADILIGPTNLPAGFAIKPILAELKVLLLSLAPIDASPGEKLWFGNLLMPTKVGFEALFEDMKKKGVKRLGFIGYNDVVGDLQYKFSQDLGKDFGIEVVTNERFARSDTSVTAQALKVIAANTDATVVGASAAPAALVNATLAERGYTKPMYNNASAISENFIRLVKHVPAANIYGTGYVVSAARTLPADRPGRAKTVAFVEAYEAKFGPKTMDSQVGSAYDAGLVFAHIAERALKVAKPGTPEFRAALRDELFKVKDLQGVLGPLTYTEGNPYGFDKRATILLKVVNEEWTAAN